MSHVSTREQRREMTRLNAKVPLLLEEVPSADWPEFYKTDSGKKLVRVMRSRHWLVQIYADEHPLVLARLSVNRTRIDGDRWQEGIQWQDLMGLKAECGYAFYDAVEVYPNMLDIVNVANMRHLWVLREKLPFAWRR